MSSETLNMLSKINESNHINKSKAQNTEEKQENHRKKTLKSLLLLRIKKIFKGIHENLKKPMCFVF